MNGPCAQARRVKDIGLVLPKYYGKNGITAPIRRTRGEIFRVCVGIGVHSLSITCLSFYIIPKKNLLLTMNVPRPRAAPYRAILRADVVFRAHAEHLRRWVLHTGPSWGIIYLVLQAMFLRRFHKLPELPSNYTAVSTSSSGE